MALESHTAALSAAVSMKKRALGPLTDWVASLVPPCNASVLTGVRQGKDASYSDERPCSGKDTFGTKARHAGFAWKALQRPQSAGRCILGRLFGLRGAARPRTWRYAITHGMKNKVYRIIPGSPVAHVPC